MNNKEPVNPLINKIFNLNKLNKEKTKTAIIILGVCAGVVLIVLNFIGGNSDNNNNNISGINNINNGVKSDLSVTDTYSYVLEQEKKICEILKRIEGVSDPFVMITLDASSEYIYASKQSIKESSSKNGETVQKEVQKDVIFYENDKNSKSPILVKEIQPKIKGVAVICKGISNAEIQLKIINFVSTVLNLPTNKVYVISSD